MYCNHRIDILRGRIDGISSGNDPEVTTVKKWLEGTPLEKALDDAADKEDAVETAKIIFNASKSTLARVARAGK